MGDGRGRAALNSLPAPLLLPPSPSVLGSAGELPKFDPAILSGIYLFIYICKREPKAYQLGGDVTDVDAH
jgi:hypothetical protein